MARQEVLREPVRAIWDLDGVALPDGTTVESAVKSFRDWVSDWSATCGGDAASAWRCPAAWRGAAASDWIFRGARLAALGRAIAAMPEGTTVAVSTRDPLLARLARQLARAMGRPRRAVQVTFECSLRDRFVSRIEPCAVAAWWCLTALARIALRVPRKPPGSVDALLLEPLVAGAPSPVRHNWGEFDPLGGDVHAVRIQVPVGFGARVGLMRSCSRQVAGAMLPEDIADTRRLLAVFGAPIDAMRRWPRSAECGGIDLCAWSGAMRRRMCFSTTLLAAALVDAAVSSLPSVLGRLRHASCWFENQPQERAFVQRVRSAFPGTRVVGYLLFHFSPSSHGGIVPTRLESAQGAIPDAVLCCGAMQRDWLRTECPWVAFEAAPLGRFALPSVVRDHGSRIATLMVPSSDAAAISMVRMASDAASLVPPGWSIRVRLHPANGGRLRMASLVAGLSVDESEPLECALARSGVVIGGGSSTIVLARSKGWPVIVLAPPGLPGMDPFPQGHRLEDVAVASSAQELAAAIRAHASRVVALEDVPTLFGESDRSLQRVGSGVSL